MEWRTRRVSAGGRGGLTAGSAARASSARTGQNRASGGLKWQSIRVILSRSAGSTLASPGLTRVAAPCGLGSVRTRGGPSPLRVASHPPEHSGSYCCDGRRVPRRECGGGQQARGPPDAVATLLPHSVGPSEVPRPAVSSCVGRPACPLEKRTGLVTLGHTHRTQAHAGTHKSTRAERDSQATEAGPWAPARPGDAAAEAARLCVAAVTQTRTQRSLAWLW